MSPYNGIDNNPISLADPDGNCTFCHELRRLGILGSFNQNGESLSNMVNSDLGGAILNRTSNGVYYQTPQTNVHQKHWLTNFLPTKGAVSEGYITSISHTETMVRATFDNEDYPKLVTFNTIITKFEIDIFSGDVGVTEENFVTSFRIRNGNILTPQSKKIDSYSHRYDSDVKSLSSELYSKVNTVRYINMEIDKAIFNYWENGSFGESFDEQVEWLEYNRSAEDTIDKMK